MNKKAKAAIAGVAVVAVAGVLLTGSFYQIQEQE